MGGFRAKDDDRERYVEVIQTAYVDGQLGAEDRELRVSRALTAETLDELEALTRDLQNQPARTIVQTPPPRVVAPEPVAVPEPVQWPVPIRRSAAPKVIGFVVAGLVALGVMAAVVPSSQDDYGSIYGEEQFSFDDGVPAADYELAPRDVRTFIGRYEAKFDTTEAHRVVLYPYRAVVQVPVVGPGSPYEMWSWDGVWQRIDDTEAVDDRNWTIDLMKVDVKQLFENIEVARSDLGVSDAEVQRVELLGASVGSESIKIVVRNSRGDRASLETTPQGGRTKSVPYAG